VLLLACNFCFPAGMFHLPQLSVPRDRLGAGLLALFYATQRSQDPFHSNINFQRGARRSPSSSGQGSQRCYHYSSTITQTGTETANSGSCSPSYAIHLPAAYLKLAVSSCLRIFLSRPPSSSLLSYLFESFLTYLARPFFLVFTLDIYIGIYICIQTAGPGNYFGKPGHCEI
jgi:hypothetical protein